MSAMTAAHVLEDFIESIEALPEELRDLATRGAGLNTQIEECRHSLYKKHCHVLRADDQRPAEERADLVAKKLEKDTHRLGELLESKAAAQQELISTLEKHLRRYDDELLRQAEYTLSSAFPMAEECADLHEDLMLSPGVDEAEWAPYTPRTVSICGCRGLPRRRDAWEPAADPDEPRFCHCRRVAFGKMLVCADPACPNEWYHLECLNGGTNRHHLERSGSAWKCPECRASAIR